MSSLPPEAGVWLAQHPEITAQELEEIWQLTGEVPPPDASFEPDPERVASMRRQLLNRITAPDETPKTAVTNTFTLHRVWTIAASILVFAAIGAMVLWNSTTVTAPAGHLRTIALNDGSAVVLNSGSSLSYRRVFGWFSRYVELEGEAFFEVAHASDPFQVQTFNGTVTVVGTQFNVRAWPDETVAETQVTLTEGIVRFGGRNASDTSVEMHAGQMSRLVGTSGVPEAPTSVDAERFAVWRSGGLAFFDARMGVALADIERRFDTDIQASDEIEERQVTLYLSEVGGIEEVLDILASLHGLQWSNRGDGYDLTEVE